MRNEKGDITTDSVATKEILRHYHYNHKIDKISLKN